MNLDLSDIWHIDDVIFFNENKFLKPVHITKGIQNEPVNTTSNTKTVLLDNKSFGMKITIDKRIIIC